jgi:hypothetical protein
MPTTNESNQTVKLGSQADKQPTPQMELQTRRTSSCANHQPNSTTFKNVTFTKTAIKQASAFNETSAKPMTSIREASKQGSSIIKEGMAIKNVIKSGSTSAQEIMAHNPWLASNTPSSKSNNHPPSAGPHAQWSKTKAEGKTKTVVLDVGLDINDLDNGMRLKVRKQPAWVMYNLGDLGTDNCQPPIEITNRLYHGHQEHPKTDTCFFGQEEHAHQSSLEIIAMLCWGPCHLQHTFLRDHSIKQTSGILATAATRYSFITSSKRNYLQTPCTQAHPITCTPPWKGGILVIGATAVNVGFQPWCPLDLAEHKQGSTTTTAVNLQWPSDGYASMQGRTNTMAGSGLNTRWTMVNPYYIFKHKLNNHS